MALMVKCSMRKTVPFSFMFRIPALSALAYTVYTVRNLVSFSCIFGLPVISNGEPFRLALVGVKGEFLV